MTISVVYQNLTKAADTISTTVDPMSGYAGPLKQCLAEAAYGHEELADWAGTVEQKCVEIGTGLFVEMNKVATALDYVATYFSTTDDQVGTCFAGNPLEVIGLPPGHNPGPPTITAPGTPARPR